MLDAVAGRSPGTLELKWKAFWFQYYQIPHHFTRIDHEAFLEYIKGIINECSPRDNVSLSSTTLSFGCCPESATCMSLLFESELILLSNCCWRSDSYEISHW